MLEGYRYFSTLQELGHEDTRYLVEICQQEQNYLTINDI